MCRLSSHFTVRGCLLVVVCLCGLACSKSTKLNSVTGKVLYKNEPLSGAVVAFHPRGTDDLSAVRPLGITKDDGTFTVASGDVDGAATGEYTVTVICNQAVKSTQLVQITMGGGDTEDRLKGAYAERDKSKITVQIKDGVNQLEPFRLE